MSDYTHTPIDSGYNTNTSINTELDAIETAVNSKADKSGFTATGNIDMNSQKVLNLPTPLTAKEPVTLDMLSTIVATPGATVHFVDTAGVMVALTGVSVGEVVVTKEFSTGNGGGGTYDVVTVGTTPHVDLPNTYNIIISTVDATKCFVLRRPVSDEITASTYGGVLDNSTDNTAVIQACIDSLSVTPIDNVDRGGVITIPRFMNFNLKNLTFVKRQPLKYFMGDDVSTTPSSNLNTNELVPFQANANNAGIVNELRNTAPFHPSYVVDVRKDVTGHESFLGGSQTQDNPARASYNIMDEQIDIWRILWENYNTATDFAGVRMHHWVQRITTTGIINTDFSTVPAKGTVITGTTSGAKGRLYTIDGTNMLLTWISGTFEVGETVSDDDETTTATIASTSRSGLVSQDIGWNIQEGQVMIGLPTNLTNGGSACNVGGKVSATNTRAYGQILPETITSPGYQWVDDWDLTSPAGLEVLMDTTVTAGRERLELHKLDNTASIGHVGAVRAYTNFSNSVASALTDFNIASIVRNSTGDYTITFTEAFARADYTVTISQRNPGDHPYIFSKTTTTVRIRNVAHGTTTPLIDLIDAIDVTIVGGDF